MTAISVNRRKVVGSVSIVFAVALLMTAMTTRSVSAERGIGMKAAKYDGRTISSDSAAKKGLFCIQDAGGGLECFDTKQEVLDSGVAVREEARAAGVSVASIAKQRKRKAKVANDCGWPPNAMAISQHGDFNYNNIGWNIAGYARQNWYNMTGEHANSASSVSAGDHSGYLADHTGGGTPRLRLEINMCERWLSRVYFNDRAQSRYRN